MTIVIPCAGKAKRWGDEFSRWRPRGPVPLFMAAGKPVIEWALDGIRQWQPAAHLVIVALHSPEMEKYLTERVPGLVEFERLSVHFTDRVRGGELETILAGRHAITDLDGPLLIVSCNVYLEWESTFYSSPTHLSRDNRASVVVARDERDWHPLPRYTKSGERIEVSADGRVIAIGQGDGKRDLLTTGTYYFASAREFLEVALEVQRTNTRVRGEIRLRSVIDVFLHRKWRVDAVTARQAWPLQSDSDVAVFENWGPLRERGEQASSRQLKERHDSAKELNSSPVACSPVLLSRGSVPRVTYDFLEAEKRKDPWFYKIRCMGDPD